LSSKHQNWANGNNLELKMPKNDHLQKSYHSCNCGKKYITQSGLWKHQKKCDGNLKFDLTNNDNVTSMLFEVIKSNQELQKQMFDLCKNGITVTNNNNLNNIHHMNSHNKTFNLKFFLNETCKDNINLQLSDLDYAKDIYNIIKNYETNNIDKN